MLSAATVLHGSERIASMLTWNDFGWDMKMRPLETAIARERRWRIRSEQTETVGLDFALRPQITNVVRSIRKNEARPEVKNAA